MPNWTQTTLEFTPNQIREALIYHYDLPKDAEIKFDVGEGYDYYDKRTGYCFRKASASFKQDLSPKKKKKREPPQPCRRDFRASDGSGPHECGKPPGHSGGCGF